MRWLRLVPTPSTAAFLIVAVPQAGCARTITISPWDLPTVAASARSEEGDIEVRLATGNTARVSGDLLRVHVRPSKGHVFVLPPAGQGRAVAVTTDQRAALKEQGWVSATTSPFPIRADVVADELVVTPLLPEGPCMQLPQSPACEEHRRDVAGTEPLSPVAYPLKSVESVVLETSGAGDEVWVGVVVGVVVGVAAAGLVAGFATNPH